MGVWIEIEIIQIMKNEGVVTPCVGVWIEISLEAVELLCMFVTPCVGVWIEILDSVEEIESTDGHSLRGSVD